MTSVAGDVALLLSIGLLCVRRIGLAIALCAVQALFAATSFCTTRPWMALLGLALNGIALPLATARMEKPTLVGGSDIVAWLAAIAMLVASAEFFTGPVAAGASVVLLGLLLALRSHAAPEIGLLSSQNGLVLVGAAHPDLPVPAALAIAVPLLPALLVADAWLRR
jgi:hypothetical protein